MPKTNQMTIFSDKHLKIILEFGSKILHVHVFSVDLDLDLVGGSGDVFVSPLDNDNVVSPVPDDVPALIVVLAFVFELDFVAGTFGAVDADVEDIGTYKNE